MYIHKRSSARLRQIQSDSILYSNDGFRAADFLRGHSVFFIPATTANDLRLRRISIPDLIHYIIFLRKSQYFPFQC